jgi:hypothetical protein
VEKFLKVIGGAVVVGASLILVIPLGAIFGYFTGWILSLFVGDLICAGLNLLFATERFTPQHIPAICSALAVLSGYLRTTVKHDKN